MATLEAPPALPLENLDQTIANLSLSTEDPLHVALIAIAAVLRSMDSAASINRKALADQITTQALSILDRHVDARIRARRQEGLFLQILLVLAGFIAGVFAFWLCD